MYETHGCHGKRTFATGMPVKRVMETNLMEEEERTLTLHNGKVDISFKPFQIVTIKLTV
jgi:alpha-mannosidase